MILQKITIAFLSHQKRKKHETETALRCDPALSGRVSPKADFTDPAYSSEDCQRPYFPLQKRRDRASCPDKAAGRSRKALRCTGSGTSVCDFHKDSVINNVFFHSCEEIREAVQKFTDWLSTVPQMVIDRLCL